jgi:hypothetical protein
LFSIFGQNPGSAPGSNKCGSATLGGDHTETARKVKTSEKICKLRKVKVPKLFACKFYIASIPCLKIRNPQRIFFWNKVLGIRDILLRIRIWIPMSVPLTNGSGSAGDPDPTPDPTPFFIDYKNTK